jgi:2-oxoglutarate dehydrogenase E2 component (dihydrolipoamide succinyltransferase)
MSIEVKVPVLPESVSDAVIATWHKKVGDTVRRDENLIDLETDKVVLEVPSPVDGVVKEIKFEAGSTVTSTQVIAIIVEGTPANQPIEAVTTSASTVASKKNTPTDTTKIDTRSLPPGAANYAARNDINPNDISGTGRAGRVSKEDLVKHVISGGGARPEQRVPMTRIRQRIAERMMQSKNSIAMLTSFNEVNLSKVMTMRKELGEPFEKTHGIKLGFMSFFAKAAANALTKHGIVNASVAVSYTHLRAHETM